MYEIEINDTVDSMVIQFPEVPLEERTIEGATDVLTLDMNIYTDFFAMKRSWSNNIAYMSEIDFNKLKGFYDRQFTLWLYPTLTISGLNVNDVVVRFTLSPRNIIDNCGEVRGVSLDFRETIQMTQDYGTS